MKLLIPGGAGYIGSHMTRRAQELGHEVIVLDDFSTGHKWAIKDCEILNLNLLDSDKLEKALNRKNFDGVIHFAAKSLVNDSMKNPNLYYRNNVLGTLNLLNAMIKNNIENIVFSSSAAVYGNSHKKKIFEDDTKNPINVYGRTKLMVENILKDICSTNTINSICFRYFNAAGAISSGEIGEDHSPETHLIPNVLNSLKDERNKFQIYGNDYSTHDGTCIRDYIHVMDLADAHLLGLDYLNNNKGFHEFNLGNGEGFSVLEVIKSCEKIVGTKIKYKVSARRDGDPSILVADSSLARKMIGWEPKFKKLDDIIESAWKWHNKKLGNNN